MIKRILMMAALALPLAALAADVPADPATAPTAPVAKDPPKGGAVVPAQPVRSATATQSSRSKTRQLWAKCNRLADGKRLTGEARKSYLVKCEKGS